MRICRDGVALVLTLTLTLTLALALAPRPGAAKVVDVQIFPSFETVGVIVRLDGDQDASSVTLEIKGPNDSSYRPAHPFVRYDARHLATSVFDLMPRASYSLRVVEGAGASTHGFTTREPLALPPPLRTVDVASDAALAAALAAARPGDLIRLAPGSYRGGLTIDVPGTAARPIVIRGVVAPATLALPVQQRSGLPVVEDAQGVGLAIAANHVVVENLQLRGNARGGIRIDSARSCVIQGCQVYDNGDWANILISGGGAAAGHHLIQDNHVADLSHDTPFRIETGGDDSVTYYGIRNDDDPGPCTVIRRNLIEGHYDGVTPCPDEEEAPNVLESDTDVLARWPAHDMELYDNVIREHRDDAIEADGVCVNARIYRNRLVRSGSPVSISPALPGPYFWVRNVMTGFSGSSVKFNTAAGRGTIRNSYFYHNTIVRTAEGTDSENAALYLYDGTASKDVFFRNNVFTSRYRLLIIQEGWVHKPDMDYNLWYTSAECQPFVYWGEPGWQTDLAGWRSNSGNDPHSVWGDPQLDGNLQISAGSPAEDGAVVIPGVNDGFLGAGPDVGHLEVGAPPRDGAAAPGDAGAGNGASEGDSPGSHGAQGALQGGCGCRLLARPATGGSLLSLVLLCLLLLRRRRLGPHR